MRTRLLFCRSAAIQDKRDRLYSGGKGRQMKISEGLRRRIAQRKTNMPSVKEMCRAYMDGTAEDLINSPGETLFYKY